MKSGVLEAETVHIGKAGHSRHFIFPYGLARNRLRKTDNATDTIDYTLVLDNRLVTFTGDVYEYNITNCGSI